MANMDWPANDEHEGRDGEPPFAGGHDARDAARDDARDEPFDLGGNQEPLDTSRLAFDEDERLPWLESPDEDDDVGGLDGTRALALLLAGLVLLAALVGGIWWATHRDRGGEQIADGGIIRAPAQPYKEAPKTAGGKTFAGTGDTAFVVAEGKSRPVKLAQKDAEPAPLPSAAASGKASGGTPAAQDTSGVGVQIAAYSNRAAAEAGWTRLSQGNEALSGIHHRVVEGQADIGTVYRLQAVTPDAASAHALCAKLKDRGMACQVKG